MKKNTDMKNASIPVILFALITLSTITATAQEITWTNITAETDLPEGVKLFSGERDSPALRVWYLDVDLNVADIALIPYLANDGVETISSFSGRTESFAAINAGYFGGGNSFSTLVQPGEVFSRNVTAVTRNNNSYPVIRSAFSIGENRDMSVDWLYHFGSSVADIYRFEQPLPYSGSTADPLPAPQRDQGELFDDLFMSVGGGPVLVKGDSVHITYNEEIFWGSGVGRDNRDPRTAAGITSDGRAILLVADGRQSVSQGLSLPELAELMIELGSTEAINLDGGGSSQMTIGTGLVNRPDGGTFQRPVATFLAVMPADSIPGEQVFDFEQIIDSGDEGVEITSGWFESANEGFYGDTPSLITAGGDGSETVRFQPDLPDENEYELFAWWVAAFNRSPNAAIVVEHSMGRDTVRVDQTTNTARWNSVGTFTFSGTSGDAVTVSNAGSSSSTFLVADAIRFVKVADDDDDVGTTTDVTAEMPGDVILHPSYPNPFNPATQISFSLNRPGTIELEIYDIAGRKVGAPASGHYTSGLHRLEWNAGDLSSGVYIIRLSAEQNGARQATYQRVTLIK